MKIYSGHKDLRFAGVCLHVVCEKDGVNDGLENQVA